MRIGEPFQAQIRDLSTMVHCRHGFALDSLDQCRCEGAEETPRLVRCKCGRLKQPGFICDFCFSEEAQ